MSQVGGEVAPGFDAVRVAFERVIDEGGAGHDQGSAHGASCAVSLDGRLVVDLWGGTAESVTSRPWRADTVCLAFSVTKGAVALLAAHLTAEGILDPDAPVALYWPEFAAVGKEQLTVRDVLSHRAGLPLLESRLGRDELLAPGTAADALAAQRPGWPPGTAFGYHALTYGWLMAAILTRAAGRSFHDLVVSRLVEPFGLDLSIGTPVVHQGRVATLVRLPSPRPGVTAAKVADAATSVEPGAVLTRALTANGALPVLDPSTWNDPLVRAAEIPGANGITNARSLAVLYGAALAGRGSFETGVLADFAAPRSEGVDRVTGLDARFGSGFMLPTLGTPMLSAASYGHEGVGGAIGFADPTHGVGFGFVQNGLSSEAGADARVVALVDALKLSMS